MIFFCFSSKDRQNIVEGILYHIQNYGLAVWYDRQQMLLGDERDYKNFVEGVGLSRYAIIVLSRNCIASECANEEIDLIHSKYSLHQIHVFPIFYDLSLTDIPPKYKWLTHLVYKELDISTDVRGTCEHIICKVLLDELSHCTYSTVDSTLARSEFSTDYDYIFKLLSCYKSIDGNNKNAKFSLLYSAILYIRTFYKLEDLPAYYFAPADFLFSETKLNLPMESREILIMERAFLLLFNAIIAHDLIKN
jgi:hypothetical protein